MDEPPQRLMAEAARLGISSKVKILEEGETMRLFEQTIEHRAPAFNPHQQSI
jgi:hypothetical protein